MQNVNNKLVEAVVFLEVDLSEEFLGNAQGIIICSGIQCDDQWPESSLGFKHKPLPDNIRRCYIRKR